jgi:hypothetical protein
LDETSQSFRTDNGVTEQRAVAGGMLCTAYFTQHAWIKASVDRSTIKRKDGGTCARVSAASADDAQFRHPRMCELQKIYNQQQKSLCPARIMRGCGQNTQWICKYCKVYLHQECHLLYHVKHASMKLDIDMM